MKIRNLYKALSLLNPVATAWNFNRPPGIDSNNLGQFHIQGIAFHNDRYYITHARPTADHPQKLLVVDKDLETISKTYQLGTYGSHPSGIQANDRTLVVPISGNDLLPRIRFYDIETSGEIQQKEETTIRVGEDKCFAAGICTYGPDIIFGAINQSRASRVVARFAQRDQIIFYRMTPDFKSIMQKYVWNYRINDTEDWYPIHYWPSVDNAYENLNIICDEKDNLFLIMYRFVRRTHQYWLDVYAITLLDDGKARLRMEYALEMFPVKNGFRNGAGLTILNRDELFVYTSIDHFQLLEQDNIISEFASRNNWPWRLVYNDHQGGGFSIAMDDEGNCIKAYNGRPSGFGDNKHFFRLGKVENATKRITWGPEMQSDTGGQIAIAMDNNGNCVEVHRGIAMANINNHYYRVGKIDGDHIDWGTSTLFDTGGQIALAMDNNNTCIEVHCGAAHPTWLYYRVGKVNVGASEIAWSNSHRFANGEQVAIAMDDNGRCVIVYNGPDSNYHYYRVGELDLTDAGDLRITWRPEHRYDTGGQAAIAMNNAGKCVEVHLGSPAFEARYHHFYRKGDINFVTGTIEWSDSIKYDTGGEVAIAFNNQEIGIEVHRGRNGTTGENHYSRLFEW